MSENTSEQVTLELVEIKKESEFFTAAYYRKPAKFSYVPGQYVELFAETADEAAATQEKQKSGLYYICTHPDEPYIGFLYQNNNLFCKQLLQNSVSSLVRMGKPKGGFTIADISDKTLYLAVQDYGIAAVRPLILEILKNRNRFGIVRLLYEVENASAFPFTRELSDWMGAIEFYDIVRRQTEQKKWFGELGTVTDILRKLDPEPHAALAILAGGHERNQELRQFFLAKNFAEENIWVN